MTGAGFQRRFLSSVGGEEEDLSATEAMGLVRDG